MPAIEAEGIVRSYGDHRGLDRFTLLIPTGCIFGLLGPNGSGKSTFLSLVAGAERPDDGTLRVFDSDPAPALRRRMGMVFQESTLDPVTTVGENLEVAGRLFGLTRAMCRKRGVELLEQFGLADRYDAPVAQLSGGMRRRVEMVRALLHDPDLVLLDEPTTGIDPGERQAIWEALAAWPASGRTVVVATNDLVEADGVCDAAAFLREGCVAAMGTPAELKAGLQREAVWLEWPNAQESDLEAVWKWSSVGSVTAEDGTVQLTVDDATSVVPRLFRIPGADIRGVRIHPATLEDAYFHHVGVPMAHDDPEAPL